MKLFALRDSEDVHGINFTHGAMWLPVYLVKNGLVYEIPAMTAKTRFRSSQNGATCDVGHIGFGASVEAPPTQDSRVVNKGCC